MITNTSDLSEENFNYVVMTDDDVDQIETKTNNDTKNF